MFFKVMCGIISKSGADIRSLVGSRSKKALSKQESYVIGCENYRFTQFTSSPHVRYQKLMMYQGEWTGIPLVTELKPHGEGLISFLDGWGFAKEDKVLNLEILECRHLNVMDTLSSDPYCDISCNGRNLQTSIKCIIIFYGHTYSTTTHNQNLTVIFCHILSYFKGVI